MDISYPVSIVSETHLWQKDTATAPELLRVSRSLTSPEKRNRSGAADGEKRYDHEEKEKKYYRRESFAGSFQRTVPLPETVDAENIDAQLKNGILTLTLPKKAEAKPRRIEVKTG